MLKPELAREQVKKAKSPNFVRQRLARLAGLAEPLRPDVRALFDPKARKDEDLDWQERQKARFQAIASYQAMPETSRQALLEAAFPGLSPYILRALRSIGRLPYTSGYMRKPFRAPSVPVLLDGARAEFLSELFSELEEYPPEIEWIATWAAHAWPYAGSFLGKLLAAAIDQNDAPGQRVFEILLASAKGEHEVGQMGRHVVTALLISERQEGWEFVEKLLLAAQREEGLRQSILEAVDEAHPEAFRRFLRVVLEHDLVRFSATVRAVDVWFGFRWDAMSTGKARQILQTALRFLDDPAAGDAAIAAALALPAKAQSAPQGKKLPKARGKKGPEAEETVESAYIALWTKAFLDVQTALGPAKQLLLAPHAEVRFVATHLLCQLGLTDANEAIVGRLEDPDPRVAARALAHIAGHDYYDAEEEGPHQGVPDLFERLEKLLARTPDKAVKLSPILWPWMTFTWGKELVGGALIQALGQRPPTRLLPYLPSFDTRTRYQAARALGEAKVWDAPTREALLAMVGDPSSQVREEALQQLRNCQVTPPEAAQLGEFLSRKASDLRRGVLTLLLSQSDDAALASADRLLDGDPMQRIGGLELLRQLAAAQRAMEACLARATAYQKSHPSLSADERTHLDALTQPPAEALTLENCLGLIDPTTRTQPTEPQPRKVNCVTPAALELLQSLDALIHTHREKTFAPRNYRGELVEEVMLGNAQWEFPAPEAEKPIQEQLERLPLKDVWLTWLQDRPASTRDADGLELLRAAWVCDLRSEDQDKAPAWIKPVNEALGSGAKPKLRYLHIADRIIGWFLALQPPAGASAFVLDVLENALSCLPKDKLAATVKRPWGGEDEIYWRTYDTPLTKFASFAGGVANHATPEEKVRLYRLCRWMDEPGAAIPRNRPDLTLVLEALAAGGATESDVYDHLLGPRAEDHYGSSSPLGRLCSLKPAELLTKHPGLGPIVDRCRRRVLEIELTRGETPTLVSAMAKEIGHAGGLQVLADFLRAAEKDTFVRGYAWGSTSKAVVFSHLIRATYPAEGDTPAAFAAAMAAARIPQDRLVELAVYAPQWADHAEHTLGWPYLAEAVWWIHAHTRDRGWSVEADLRERWKAQVAQRTPLEAEDLLDGAVDVAWFGRTYAGLGSKRWEALCEAAKYAASGGGHKRAQLFAEAMLGQVKAKELLARIKDKRYQDAARALGLLPLPEIKLAEKRKAKMLARYHALQEFIRTSRQFGSMRQASEKRAATIGMENLARTAGYADPIRLSWAMEAQACADLAKGPVKVAVGDVTVTLALSAGGEPELTCARKDKVLANLPPAVRKNPKVAELAERKTDLKRSASRMRTSLETAMVRGDQFAGAELAELVTNPLLAPLLERLVFVGEGIMGYPVAKGRGLVDYAGKTEPVKKTEKLRLAHPHDLLAGKHWSDWQRDCFGRERVQPFKQVFRELYVLTKTEANAQNLSRRYAGHQVQPRQALALLGSRGWVTAPEEGVFKTFHDLGLTAWVTFQEGFFTPADIEGLTLEGVCFTKRKLGHGAIPLKDIPPRVFSEVMRDLDLVVSVAHRGGVDPEASASTIQMRAALLGETLQLLALKNVRVKDNHALIKGQLGDYTVHLGSAVTHRQPGGALFIVAVHSQHRGRLFLPFADDDPKTAEVLSKVILLARDREIKDPNLLAQVRAAAS